MLFRSPFSAPLMRLPQSGNFHEAKQSMKFPGLPFFAWLRGVFGVGFGSVMPSPQRGAALRNSKCIRQSYALARESYAARGVDAELALQRLRSLSISLHCWQGDDVGGFENRHEAIGGGLAVTGNYPGKARTPSELRQDLEKALSLIPGQHRLNLHASYGEFGGKRIDRDAIEARHFSNWIEWAKSKKIGRAHV